MCEFCTSHGEGKRWYENIRNYTREVFSRVNSEDHLREYLRGFSRSMGEGVRRAALWKKRMPRLYGLIARPLITRHLKRTHFGQIVTLEDAEGILARCGTIVRLPCVCRKVATGREARYCFGIGLDLRHVLKDVPDFRDFELMPVAEAVRFVRRLDEEGMVHSIWTFNTPFIGALCNCDRDCMAYRFQAELDLGKVMWKGEYVCRTDPLLCNGCGECMKRCHFGAIVRIPGEGKCSIDLLRCYGCGLCRAVCANGAIGLQDRAGLAEAAVDW